MCLDARDEAFVELLKSLEIIPKVAEREVCKNGGVKNFCGDGYVKDDMITFHGKSAHKLSNAHAFPAGPKNFCLDFLLACYSDEFTKAELIVVRRWLVASMKKYMKLKSTRTVFNTFHYPCGAAKDAGISLKDVFVKVIPEVDDFFNSLTESDPNYFKKGRIHYKIHLVKKKNGVEVQRTRVINMKNLRDNLSIIQAFKW